MGYNDDKKEQLKHFLRNSTQIEKIKYNNTNKLFYKADEDMGNTITDNPGK